MILMLDAAILGALCGCMIYAGVLHRRLRRLKIALDGLRPAIEEFSAAAERTEGSVRSLRSAADHMAGDAGSSSGGWRAAVEQADKPERAPREAGAGRTRAKQDLIRSFFEDARRAQA
jgi:hypothetical protein